MVNGKYWTHLSSGGPQYGPPLAQNLRLIRTLPENSVGCDYFGRYIFLSQKQNPPLFPSSILFTCIAILSDSLIASEARRQRPLDIRWTQAHRNFAEGIPSAKVLGAQRQYHEGVAIAERFSDAKRHHSSTTIGRVSSLPLHSTPLMTAQKWPKPKLMIKKRPSLS